MCCSGGIVVMFLIFNDRTILKNVHNSREKMVSDLLQSIIDVLSLDICSVRDAMDYHA